MYSEIHTGFVLMHWLMASVISTERCMLLFYSFKIYFIFIFYFIVLISTTTATAVLVLLILLLLLLLQLLPLFSEKCCCTHCCPGAGNDETSDTHEQRWCSLLTAAVGCLHKCLMYNREDKDNSHDVGGLFTIDCMKMLMSPLVDQVSTMLQCY